MMQNSQVIPRAQESIVASLYRSKLTKLFAVGIILFSISQLGLHFWPQSSLVYGIRIDYLSPTFYFLDVLIVLYIFVSNFLKKNNVSQKTVITTLIVILLVNLLYSQNPLSSLTWSLHVLLYSVFLVSEGASSLYRYVIRYFPALLVFEFGLSTAQVWLGHSVGGIFYYLGERLLAVGGPGVALGSLTGQVILRAYGTFSHPNILAGWATLVCYLYLRVSESKRSKFLVVVFSGLITILAQSRSAAISLFFIIIPFYYLKKKLYRAVYLFIICLLALNFSFFNPSRYDLSLLERQNLGNISRQIIIHNPIFGVGAQSSISAYPNVAKDNRLLQPDHNILVLALSWFGLAGILALIAHFPNKIIGLVSFFAPLTPLFLLDHYFITSPQGLFIFLLIIRVGVNYPHVQKNRQQHPGTTSS